MCFEQVVKELETEYDEERDRKRVLERRMYRKNRERFIGLLGILYTGGYKKRLLAGFFENALFVSYRGTLKIAFLFLKCAFRCL